MVTLSDVRKLTPAENEALFQETDDWSIKWYCVTFACENLAKKQLQGINIGPEKFEQRVGEAVFECMEKIKRGDKPDKLSSWCYWPVRRALWSKSAIQEDRECLSYEEHTENILAQENIGDIE
jgi:hypothetical protein